MSMNVILVKSGTVTSPNGKQTKLSESYKSILQTRTNDSYDIINLPTLEEQVKKYKEVVSTCFIDYEHKIFQSFDDELDYSMGNKNIKFQVEIETAEEQLEEHMSEMYSFINDALDEGYDVSFKVI